MDLIGSKLSNRQGVECPECGDTHTDVTRTGRDDEMRKLRARRCENCFLVFATVEVPIVDSTGKLVMFNHVDTERKMKERERTRKKRGYQEIESEARFAKDMHTLTVRTKVYPSRRNSNG